MGLLTGFRLSARRALRSRVLRNLVLVFAVYNLLEALRLQRVITRTPAHDPRRPRKAERVYIAGMHYNSAGLIKEHWNAAVLSLVEALGRDNVYVSVYESGSWDESKRWLRELDDELFKRGVRRNVVLDDRTHKQEVEDVPGEAGREGWIVTPRGKREMRRIPFLAALRNLTLRDLWRLGDEGEGFDKILFLNDVVFKAEDVLALLDTNGGLYAAACSLDFSDPPYYYDTFALRDANGQAHLMQTWPYFRSRQSREALMANSDAVPVRSCWNGIVAMPAAPFLASAGGKRLKFRAVDDSLAEEQHLEASECCLIHVDNPLTEPLGVFLNPRVRVGYDGEAYRWAHPADGASWVSVWRIVLGVWEGRFRRWFSTDGVKEWVVRKRVKEWEGDGQGRRERGVDCLINEGQVLVYNGWAHV